MVRVIDAQEIIGYSQDILVNLAFQNEKVGSFFMEKVLEKFQQVRQKVLLTTEEPNIRSFYQNFGFPLALKEVPLLSIERFNEGRICKKGKKTKKKMKNYGISVTFLLKRL